MPLKSILKSTRFAATMGAILGLSSLLATSPALSADATEEKKPAQILFTNVNIFDGFKDKLSPGMSVLVEDNYIKEVGKSIKALMPTS